MKRKTKQHSHSLNRTVRSIVIFFMGIEEKCIILVDFCLREFSQISKQTHMFSVCDYTTIDTPFHKLGGTLKINL